jgi:hypothetical protein
MKKLIFENGTVLDLPQDLNVKVSKKNADIGTPGGVFVGVTNVFNLPFSYVNDLVFGLARKIESVSNAPYQISNVSLLDDDQPLILNGKLVLVRSKDNYEIVVIDINTTFFERIKDVYINDLEPDDANCYGGLDATAIAARITATDYMVSPVMKWGELDISAACIDVKRDTYLPCFYYHTLITVLLTAFGVTSCLDYPDGMDKIAIPMGNKAITAKAKEKFFTRAIRETPQSATISFDYMAITFESKEGDKNNYFDLTAYNVPSSLPYNINLKFKLRILFEYTPGTGNIVLGPSAGFNAFTTAGTYDVTLEYVIKVGDGETVPSFIAPSGTYGPGVLFGFEAVGTGHYINVLQAELEVSVDEDSPFVDKVNYLQYLPQLKATDLLSDYMARYFLAAKEDNGSLCSKSFDAIANGTAMVDWTSKREAKIKDEITYKDDRFAKSNIMQYANQLGRGVFAVDNENLVESKTYFTSVFNGIVDEYINVDLGSGNFRGCPVAALNVIPEVGDENTNVSTPLTLVALRSQATGDPPIKFEGVTKTTYFVAYFDDPNYPSMHFQRFIDTYGGSFIKALRRFKYVGRYYNLTPLDVYLFDSFKLVMDDGILYYVDDILDFETNLPTKVNLLKLE